MKRALVRRQEAMRRRQERAKRPPSWLWSIFDPKKKLVRAVLAIAEVFRPRRPSLDAAQIAAELARIDETMHAIDSCKLQIEGKLINLR